MLCSVSFLFPSLFKDQRNRNLPWPLAFSRRAVQRAVRLAIVLTLAALTPPSHAGFVQDFYDNAAAQTNLTPAGIYRSAEMGVITGGHFVAKVPRQDFQPYSIDAPHLKAGCGGIDFYLGAFSIPSQDEFVSFLRSIGTALPGVAFQIALNAMAPELNETLSQYRDMLMEFSNSMGDSCQAAEKLMNYTGASAWLQNSGQAARNYLRSSGRAEDAADAQRMTRTNGAMTLNSVPERRTNGGTLAQASELNLTWSLLKSGKATRHATQSHLEMLMTLVGSTIYTRTGSGDDETVRQIPLAAQPLLDDLIGSPDGQMQTTLKHVYHCDTPDRCLNPTLGPTTELNLSASIYRAMTHYRQALMQRNPGLVSADELQHLASITSIPLLSFVEITASPMALSFSESFLKTYAEAAAYEAILASLSGLADELRVVVTGSSGKDISQLQAEHAKTLEMRIDRLCADLRRKESLLSQRLQRVSDFIDEVEHLRRKAFGTAADALYEQMPSRIRY